MPVTQKQIGVQNFYATTVTSVGGIPSTGDVTFTVAVPLNTDRGYIIVDPANSNLREIMYYYDVSGNTISVLAANRTNPHAHAE